MDNRDFFIRCLVLMPVRGISEKFGFGVWSSLSKENFLRYQDHYDEDLSDWQPMFGYLANRLPEYPDTLNLHLSIQTQAQGKRPLATLEPGDHPFSIDQREGMALEKVLRIVDPFLHG